MTPWPYPEHNPFPSADHPLDEDLRLAALVAQRLSIDWSTRRQQIAVTVQNRVVILTGLVADHATRRAAAELAWDVPGVVDVCNALTLFVRGRGRR
ncbi:osmotically-inducible protein OsmY [Micromonospora sp. A200]|uniref:BON domain-containing protein n=1 Tax=Micromonospora sp. A200 TaxID=2940568 RepID=UPI002472EB19|nr:BON domain-containing protein [Micromonospora sp. A200]MDH6462698.1 osmotically-inducible protein OsmY [Micromonospora sp. A200]